MRARGLYELKPHFQWDCLFQADKWFREKYCPGTVRGWKQSVNFTCRWTCQIWTLKSLFIMTCWKESSLHSQPKILVFGSKSIFGTNILEEWRITLRFGRLLAAGGRCEWAFCTNRCINWSPAHISVSKFWVFFGTLI